MIELDEARVGRLLVGHPVAITIGEPWDFESKDGPNFLRGRVAAVSEESGSEQRRQWVRLEVTPFEAEEGSTIRYLTAFRRYQDQRGLIEQLARGEAAEVNLHYDDQVNVDRMPEGISPFLIGGVELRELR